MVLESYSPRPSGLVRIYYALAVSQGASAIKKGDPG